MGQGFSWDAVQNGRVPNPAGIQAVLSSLKLQLDRESNITHALIFGSVTRGDFGVRSDIDASIVYPGDKMRDIHRVTTRICNFAAHHHVSVSFAPCRVSIAGTRLHHFGPSFRKHLERCLAKGLIKGGLGIFAFNLTNAIETESYVRFKMHKLESKWLAYSTLSDADKAKFLQKMLEAPSHVARRVLARMGWFDGDSKEQVFQAYCTHLPGLSKWLERLLALDREYSAELERQLLTPDEDDYRTFLGYLEEQVYDTLDFVEANLLYIESLER